MTAPIHARRAGEEGDRVQTPRTGEAAHFAHAPRVGEASNRAQLSHAGEETHLAHASRAGEEGNRAQTPRAGEAAHFAHAPRVGEASNRAQLSHAGEVAHFGHASRAGEEDDRIQPPRAGEETTRVQTRRAGEETNRVHAPCAGEAAPRAGASREDRRAGGAKRVERIHTTRELQARADGLRTAGRRIALVPTMGALHAGHMALVDAARAPRASGGGGADFVVLSIYVNPAQFNAAADLAAYPRTLAADLARCEERGVDAVFLPSDAELYPDGAQTWVEVSELSKPLEGRARPGHFRGVATVVTKLLLAARPQVAAFGEKDFQQLALLRRLVRDLGFDVEVLGVPTLREPDGLALSSRNALLAPEARAQASVLSRALDAAAAAFRAGERRARTLAHTARMEIEKAPLARVEYVELCAPDTLETWDASSAPPLARETRETSEARAASEARESSEARAASEARESSEARAASEARESSEARAASGAPESSGAHAMSGTHETSEARAANDAHAAREAREVSDPALLALAVFFPGAKGAPVRLIDNRVLRRR